MDISVVIPSYNSQEVIEDTLDAIVKQQTSCLYEVIVVDCSDDDRVEQLVARRERANCVRREQRFNPGEGRNMGAEVAQGELLMFVDADVELDSDALTNAWTFYQQGNLLFGGALELDERHGPTAASYLEHYFFNHEAQRQRPPRDRANLSSALLLVERALFIRHGGFTDIPRMQDTEFTERLRCHGVRVGFTPSVVGFQIQDAPMSKVLKKIFINGQNLYSIRYRKNMTVTKKIVFMVLLPLLTSAKVIRIVGRHLRYQNLRNRCITLLLVPLLFLSGFYWMVGFYHGLINNRGVSQQR